MEVDDLPYRAEYAKSGRAGCRGCKSTIEKDTLRLAVMVQSPMFDGKTPQWYHFLCFFMKQRPKTVDDIAHFESLRWDDQEKIKEKIGNSSAIILPSKKGQKRDAAETKAKKGALKDFVIEYSKSSRATCRGCEQKIIKDEIRISKKDFETEVGRKYGGQDMWHHVSCFAKLRSELGYFESAEALPGFKTLKKEDQKETKTHLPAIKQEDVPDIKKQKVEDEVDGTDKKEKEMRDQNKTMFKYRDRLKNELNKKEMILLLEANGQEIPAGEERILDRLSDIMTFGTLEPCNVCNGGQFVFNKIGYICQGDLTEWTKCNTVSKEPRRSKFIIPDELAANHKFLAKYKYVPRTRLFKEVSNIAAVKKEDTNDQPKVIREKPPLYNMEFVILGTTVKPKDDIKTQITKLGGKVVTKIHRNVMAVISTPVEVEKMGSRMTLAESENVHVVSEDFIDEAKSCAGKINDLVIKKSICNWGSDPNTRLPAESSNSKSKSRSMYEISKPSKIKLKLKGGGAVDPESGLEDVAHVYQDNTGKYTAILGLTDIQRGKNSYYKLQLLASDKGSQKYWIFKAWGRIGTTIGSNKVEEIESLHSAKKHFCCVYEEKTGNMWENKEHFVKVPGRMYPIDVEYEEDSNIKMEITDEQSKLPTPVQDLIRLIFDVNSMKKVMLEFELDTEKMPLGKLSKKQIQSAFGVLSEIQDLIKKDGPLPKLIDASNRFYTFIPHSFGVNNPPVIKEEEVVKQKLDMLDNLMELEIAYNMMKATGSNTSVDSYYTQLRAELNVLDKTSEEFMLIEEYVKNTHAKTHGSYELEIVDVFTVKRQGEDKRYKPFKKLHNKKLLWHGSRVTNYAGILSQGLRIAPPEAPVTGYMFGKGIYFADMVSKSANYCATTPSANTGLLLLCEVALGDMHECKNASYIEKLPKGKHSTKGLGMTEPDSSKAKVINGVEIPLGPGVPVEKLKSSLLYNEYIVYDVAQVKQKYLLKVNFQYKY